MTLLKLLWFLAIFALLYRESEAGEFCISTSGCSGLNVCCQSECLPSCVDHSCLVNSDCGGVSGEYCCDDKCQVGRCSLPGWAIALIVIAALFVLTSAGVKLYYCTIGRRSDRPPGLIVAVPVAVAGSNVNYGAVYPQPEWNVPIPAHYHQPAHQHTWITFGNLVQTSGFSGRFRIYCTKSDNDSYNNIGFARRWRSFYSSIVPK